jgi:hypothetical protein
VRTSFFLLLTLAIVSFGCSSEMTKRAAYESLKNKADMDCRKNPGAQCPEQKSYDEYQRDLNRR